MIAGWNYLCATFPCTPGNIPLYSGDFIKKGVIILALLLLLSPSSKAQQNSIDSLKQLLQTKISDSLSLRIQLRLSELHQFKDFAESFRYANEAVVLANKMNEPWAKAAGYRNLGYYHTLSGDYITALKYDDIAMQNSILTGDSSLIAACYNLVGNDYYDIGKYDDAYFYFTQSYSVSNKIKDSLNMTIALHNVGRVFKELGEYGNALDHLSLSSKISIKINDKPGMAYYYDELGDIQIRQKNYDSALVTLFKALRFIQDQGLKELEPRTLTKIATTYLHKKDSEKSLAYYDSTGALYEMTNNKFGQAQVNLGKGIVYIQEEAYDKAERLITGSLAVAHHFNARILEIECYKHLYTIWEHRGDFYKALENFKKYKILEDSLFSQEMLQKLYRDQLRFETESKDLKIAALSLLETRQKEALKREEFIRNILAVVFALSIILLVTVYRSGQRRKQINELLLQHQNETERRSEELERLNQVKDKFFSIISHDLRSPINALSGILNIMAKGGLSKEDFEAQTLELRVRFDHTRTLLNNLLDWTLLQMDKLNLQATKIDLYKIVEENISLLTSLQSKHIQLINNLAPESIGFADSNTINLVIRNLITNAIKFTNDGGEVTINAKSTNKEWVLSVHDNGIGIKPEVQKILFDKTSPYTTRGTANEKGTGLGLILCKEFVEKNGGKIWVESQEDEGSTFFFTIPKPPEGM